MLLFVYYTVHIYYNPVAQSVEQHPFKVMVVGSNPTRITNLIGMEVINNGLDG